MFHFRQFLLSAAALFILGFVPTSILAQTAGPVLFYSDLTDGPRTGGENGKGAYVCVYGRNFGSAQGTSTITVGGVAVASYPVWGDGNAPARGDSKACFQLGNSVPTGSQTIQMTTSAGASNTLPFTVRPDAADAIYCVSDVALPSGSTAPSDSNTGHFGSCWATVNKALQSTMPSGAIYYLHNVTGVGWAGNYNAGWLPSVSGTLNAMNAVVGYPGSTATLGSAAVGWQNGNYAYGVKLNPGNDERTLYT